jgi:hypothetical protein
MFLSSESSTCLHDPLMLCESLDDLDDMLDLMDEPIVGASDTASAYFFNEIYARWPDAKYLFVFRRTGEISRSLRNIGVTGSKVCAMQRMMYEAWAQVEGKDNAMAVLFDDLSKVDTLRAIWQHMIGTEFDEQRAIEMAGENIQVDVDMIRASLSAPRMLKLIKNVKGLSLEESINDVAA